MRVWCGWQILGETEELSEEFTRSRDKIQVPVQKIRRKFSQKLETSVGLTILPSTCPAYLTPKSKVNGFLRQSWHNWLLKQVLYFASFRAVAVPLRYANCSKVLGSVQKQMLSIQKSLKLFNKLQNEGHGRRVSIRCFFPKPQRKEIFWTGKYKFLWAVIGFCIILKYWQS